MTNIILKNYKNINFLYNWKNTSYKYPIVNFFIF